MKLAVFFAALLWAGVAQAEPKVCADLNDTYTVVKGTVIGNYPLRRVGVRGETLDVAVELTFWSEGKWQSLLNDLHTRGGYIAYQMQEGKLMAAGVVVDAKGICTSFTAWHVVPPPLS